MSLSPEVQRAIREQVTEILSERRFDESFAERLRTRVNQDRQILRRLSRPTCSCPGALWDSIYPPPRVCGLHGV